MNFEKVVIVGGAPRNGTSWLGQIINSSPEVSYKFQPLFSYKFKGVLNTNSTKEDIMKFFEDLYFYSDEFITQSDKVKSGSYPVFNKVSNPPVLSFKTCRYQYIVQRMILKTECTVLLGIIRNPCAALSSWMNTEKEFPRESNRLNHWRYGECKNEGKEESFYGFYKWKEVVNMYLDLEAAFPNRVLIVKYEDLVDNPVELSERIFEFCGISYDNQTQEFVSNCHNVNVDDPYSVFKTKSVKTAWKHLLEDEIITEVYEDLRRTRLEKFLL